jgi:Tetratricopeptide repeat
LVAIDQGAWVRAKEVMEESLALRQQLQDRWGIATSLHNLGTVARAQGDLTRAAALYEESAGIRDALGDVAGLAISARDQALLALALGDELRALLLLRRSVTYAAQLGDTIGMAQGLEGLATVTTRQGRSHLAAQLLGAAAVHREHAGAALTPGDRAQHDQVLAIVRAVLGMTFADSWSEGRGLPWEQLVGAATQGNEGAPS